MPWVERDGLRCLALKLCGTVYFAHDQALATKFGGHFPGYACGVSFHSAKGTSNFSLGDFAKAEALSQKEAEHEADMFLLFRPGDWERIYLDYSRFLCTLSEKEASDLPSERLEDPLLPLVLSGVRAAFAERRGEFRKWVENFAEKGLLAEFEQEAKEQAEWKERVKTLSLDDPLPKDEEEEGDCALGAAVAKGCEQAWGDDDDDEYEREFVAPIRDELEGDMDDWERSREEGWYYNDDN